MGMPKIENISPTINLKKEQVINLLLTSIAIEELSLAHIMNAEGEKIQKAINDGHMDTIIDVDKGVERILKDVIKKEMLLEFKFENILDLCKECPEHPGDC
jgi:hypothetical protein